MPEIDMASESNPQAEAAANAVHAPVVQQDAPTLAFDASSNSGVDMQAVLASMEQLSKECEDLEASILRRTYKEDETAVLSEATRAEAVRCWKEAAEAEEATHWTAIQRDLEKTEHYLRLRADHANAINRALATMQPTPEAIAEATEGWEDGPNIASNSG